MTDGFFQLATAPLAAGTAEAVSELRAGVVAWLADNGSDFEARHEAEPTTLEAVMLQDLELQRALWDAGFTRWGWPESCGGNGGSAILRAAVYETLALRGFRIPAAMLTVETLGPAMVEHAPDLAARFLAPCLRGDEVWCQGFSEPEAGSDLAALRCRATPVADGWELSGQKTWSSFGSMSQRTAMLARTGGAGHRGITMFLVDLDSDGCEVRPIRASSGRNEFAEIFFDGAVVEHDRVIGVVDLGWEVAMSLLQWERGMYAWQRQAVLHAHLARIATMDLSPATRRTVAGVWVQLTALRSASARTVRRLAAGENPGPEISFDKIMLSLTEQAVLEVLRTLSGADFVLGASDADQVLRGDWFYARMATIYGGALEIQRSILAERVLGLPRASVR